MSHSTADNSTGGSRSHILPDFHLLCMNEKFSDAFHAAQAEHFPNLYEHTTVTVHNCSLKYLPQDLRFDAVVSPANSYARLDGAFDDALARAYAPRGDYGWITRKAQQVVYEKWRGFAPTGICTTVRLDHDGVTAREDSSGHVTYLNPWGTEYLLLLPTMRIPDDVRWNREIVYECIWSMLCDIDGHNRALRNGNDSRSAGKKIESVLMTPLATGVGLVSAKKWAEQCVIAMKQYVEAVEQPAAWSSLEWGKILTDHEEIAATYNS